MKSILLLSAFCITCISFAQPYTLKSPDNKIEANLSVSEGISYRVSVDGKIVINYSPICFGTTFSRKFKHWTVKDIKTSTQNATLSPVVQLKSKTITDNYNQLIVSFANGLSLEWRVFNNGVAWRWVSNHRGDFTVWMEEATFKLDKKTTTFFPLEDNVFYSHHERIYQYSNLADLGTNKFASLPALFETNGIKLLITESNLLNYAGMFLETTADGVKGVFPYYPKVRKFEGDRDEKIPSAEDFISKAKDKESFPWSAILVARTDNELLTNQLVYQLADASVGDFSWVKPGKVSWDWWNANNIYNVDFKAGINTATYKHYIDFAAKYGLQYIILDEGWSDTKDLMKVVPEINMEELTKYAEQKGVGVILWTTWWALRDKMIPALDLFAKWGVKGVKVDFMQRDDQEMVNFYVTTAKEAAKRKMLVDFHGAYKPTGLDRTFPNVISYEGVFGMENAKWDTKKRISPEHDVTIPFTRMVAGAMDYTPGAMVNAQEGDWHPINNTPMSLGTRCHQLAMYVVFESPLQMLSDIPTNYYKEPKCMEFLKDVPTVWEETVPLTSKVGDYIAIARKAKNGNWYIGAMTDWTGRDLDLNLSFLDAGKYKLKVWKDGANADRNANDFATEVSDVDKTKTLKISMAKGGGWAAVLERM